MSATLRLYGLDVSNPLAFLAALGTLRSLSLLWPEERVRLAWKIHGGAWRPMLEVAEPRESALICAALAKQLRPFEKHPALAIGDDLTIDAKTFAEYARQAASEAERDRTWADFAGSFGCESLTRKDKNEIFDTAFRTMAGAGHQHFLKSMRNICRETTAAHLEKALFSAWRYNDRSLISAFAGIRGTINAMPFAGMTQVVIQLVPILVRCSAPIASPLRH